MSTGISSPAKVGRPRVEVPVSRILELRAAGQSWRKIARSLGFAVTTIRRAHRAGKERI